VATKWDIFQPSFHVTSLTFQKKVKLTSNSTCCKCQNQFGGHHMGIIATMPTCTFIIFIKNLNFNSNSIWLSSGSELLEFHILINFHKIYTRTCKLKHVSSQFKLVNSSLTNVMLTKFRVIICPFIINCNQYLRIQICWIQYKLNWLVEMKVRPCRQQIITLSTWVQLFLYLSQMPPNVNKNLMHPWH
jgi:hypothetical protein